MDLRMKQPSSLSTLPKSASKEDVQGKEIVLCPYSDCYYESKCRENVVNHEKRHGSLAVRDMAREASWGYDYSGYKTSMAYPRPHVHLDVGSRVETAAAVADTRDLSRSSSTESQVAKEVCVEGAILYRCTICNYRSIWKHNLTRHSILHANRKTFSCPINGCDYRAKCSLRVRKHYELIHHAKLPPKKRLINQEIFWLDQEFENNMEKYAHSNRMELSYMLCGSIGTSKLYSLECPYQHKTFVKCRNVQISSMGHKSF